MAVPPALASRFLMLVPMADLVDCAQAHGWTRLPAAADALLALADGMAKPPPLWYRARLAKAAVSACEASGDSPSDLCLDVIVQSLRAPPSDFCHVTFEGIALRVLDPKHAGSVTGDASIGLRLWPAALVLQQYLKANWDAFDCGSVLEIGAGVGFVGLWCASAGARTVLTDYNDSVLDNLARNAADVPLATVARFDWHAPDAGFVADARLVLMADCV